MWGVGGGEEGRQKAEKVLCPREREMHFSKCCLHGGKKKICIRLIPASKPQHRNLWGWEGFLGSLCQVHHGHRMLKNLTLSSNRTNPPGKVISGGVHLWDVS